jgi:hypothetical protein
MASVQVVPPSGRAHSFWRAFWLSDVQLTKDEAASTFFRFFRSKHVDDLRLIVKITVLIFTIHVILVIILAIIMGFSDTSIVSTIDSEVSRATPDVLKVKSDVSKATPWLESFKFAFAYIGPALPIYGAIIAWAYLSASGRLGVVDLFACEIATLCRVGTLFDVGQRYVDMMDGDGSKKPATGSTRKGPAAGTTRFDSEENYFPVFSSNSGDLKVLEALVVSNIAAFYTYMKAARDLQRKIASETDPDTRRNAVADMIYVLFLGYERARNAVNDLIEFQPVKDENTIVILITELKCYSFLHKHYARTSGDVTQSLDGVRHARLQLRKSVYMQVVPDLYRRVTSHGEKDEDWCEARNTVSALESCYENAIGEDLKLAAGPYPMSQAAKSLPGK